LRLGFHLEPGMRVGLFGGSFDPAHSGHALVAQTALTRLGLDRVIWLVSPHNPLKRHRAPDLLSRRMASARGQARGPSMIVSDVESRLGAAYTVNTLRLLKAKFPRVHFVWIMGADNLAGFHGWRGWTAIMRLVPVAVVARPGALMESRFSPAARRFAHARRSSREGLQLPTLPAPAWAYFRAP
jgi:nicotinate-nucleotide adenylyltransferase